MADNWHSRTLGLCYPFCEYLTWVWYENVACKSGERGFLTVCQENWTSPSHSMRGTARKLTQVPCTHVDVYNIALRGRGQDLKPEHKLVLGVLI